MSIYIEKKNLICIQGDQDLKKKTALVSGEKKKVFFGYEIY